MKTTRFKTTIKCSGCVETVTKPLNETVGENNWEVDLNDPSRVLTIKGDVSESAIRNALQQVGYKAEKLN